MASSPLNACYLLLLVLISFDYHIIALSVPLRQKPDPADAAATARWLASENSWGVLSTISSDKGGAPFGNVDSFSDGWPGDGRGIPYFYLTTLDPTARNALKDARASLTLSEFPLGSCGKIDPENPVCSKLTLTGKLTLVDGNSKEANFAKQALFSKHAEMKEWPKNHNFQVFKLEIEDIFLIDWFGGPKPLSLDEYLHPRMVLIVNHLFLGAQNTPIHMDENLFLCPKHKMQPVVCSSLKSRNSPAS
ncbi:hypothetical protein AMTRI_Chr10g227960 [Amborella trichopoda]